MAVRGYGKMHAPADRPGAAHGGTDGLVRHSGHGVRYAGTVHTTRAMECGMSPSAGTVGDSYGNAMAESVNGAYETGLVRRREPLPGPRGSGAGDVPVGLVADSSGRTGPWATGHRRRWKSSTMQTKRHKPPHYKGGTKIRPLQSVFLQPNNRGTYHPIAGQVFTRNLLLEGFFHD